MSRKRTTKSKNYLPFVIIGGVLAIAIGGGTLLFRSARQPRQQPAATIPNTLTVPPRMEPGAQPPHVRGTSAAPVEIEEFGDFQCPPCGQVHPMLKKIEADYGSRLRVVFRHFPLANIHKHAVDAARAAEAAARQGRFWEMHDLLYENQLKWSVATDVRALFVEYARTLGLDTEQFKRDMDAMDVNSRVIADQRRGASLGVTGTPTMFLNGREVPTASVTNDGLRAAIDTALGGKAQ